MEIVFSYLAPIAIGVSSSLVSSYIFLRYRLALKPSIRISDDISYYSRNDRVRFEIKAINTTKAPIINVNAELSLVSSYGIKGGKMYEHEKIQLKTEHKFQIDKFNKKDEKALFAWRFVCYENLHERWSKDDQYLNFKIIATHSESGFSQCFEKNYYDRSSHLLPGKFGFGESLVIS